MENRDKRASNSSLTNVLGSSTLKINAPNLAHLFVNQGKAKRLSTFAEFRTLAGELVIKTWEDAIGDIARLANYLNTTAGVKKGDRVAILSITRYEWMVADLAILACGGISTSIYHSLTSHEVGFVLWDADASVVFIENEEQFNKITKLESENFEIPPVEEDPTKTVSINLSHLISFEKCNSSRVTHLSNLSRENKPFEENLSYLLDLSKDLTQNDDASLVYTSGTTGAPKGVIQTHGNHIAMVESALQSGLLGNGERVFLYLPLAHSFARLCAYSAIAPGGNILFPTIVSTEHSKFDSKRVMKDLQASNSYIFPSVPRIFEKVMETLTPEHPKTFQIKLSKWAIKICQEIKEPLKARELGSAIKIVKLRTAKAILDKVKKSIFGNNLRYCVSGGAPISKEVIDFFESIGVRIYQGYGLTETTPAISANTSNFNKIGTVGRPFPCNEIRLDEADGELLVSGQNIARGYWKRPLSTKSSWNDLDGKSWFRTGDIVEIDEEGYISITDRKKDLIVFANGKKVAPALIEAKLRTSNLISQAVLFGDKHSYLVALITLTEKQTEEIYKKIQNFIDWQNEELANFEQIKKFAIVEEDFSIENGLLSPTLKVKRKLVGERYKNLLNELYSTNE